MVQIIAGEKGHGKTKRLLKMANDALKTTEGHIVFIDDDNRHMYDLNHKIRFVETSDFPLSNYRELIGFICGIISQNNDIKEIFIDGVGNVVKNFDNEALVKLLVKLENLSEANQLDFIFTINANVTDLPEEAQKLVIA